MACPLLVDSIRHTCLLLLGCYIDASAGRCQGFVMECSLHCCSIGDLQILVGKEKEEGRIASKVL